MTNSVPVSTATSAKISGEDICLNLPEPPEKPEDSNCCGTGCTPCVFDIYEEEMSKWRKECERIKSGENVNEPSQLTESVLSNSEFRPFKLESVTVQTSDSCIYRFHILKNKSLGLGVGQHLIMRGNFGGKSITRQYTPVSTTDCYGFFDVLIKVYPNGKMSSYVQSWHVGDIIEWRGPFGRFSYIPSKETEADRSKVKYGDNVSYGRINQDRVTHEMPEPSRDIQVLICGTKSFDKDMINYLKALGYTPDMYFKF